MCTSLGPVFKGYLLSRHFPPCSLLPASWALWVSSSAYLTLLHDALLPHKPTAMEPGSQTDTLKLGVKINLPFFKISLVTEN